MVKGKGVPTSKSSNKPIGTPISKSSSKPTGVPTSKPSSKPTTVPTSKPSNNPTAVPTAKSRLIFVSDADNNRVQRFVEGSSIGATVAYTGTAGSSKLRLPGLVFVDPSGILYVADSANNRILKWDNATRGMTIADSSSGTLGSDDKSLDFPLAVFVNSTGAVYVADTNNNRIMV